MKNKILRWECVQNNLKSLFVKAKEGHCKSTPVLFYRIHYAWALEKITC